MDTRTRQALDEWLQAQALDDDDDNGCIECGGKLQRLGRLGRLTWFRCRQCGTEFGAQDDRADDA